MSICTKKGDKGETSLVNGQRVKKNDLKIEAYGYLDEVNSLLGLVSSFLEDKETKSILEEIQNDLFNLGASLFPSNGRKVSFDSQRVKAIEEWINFYENKLGEEKAFILPQGKEASFLHFLRTRIRKLERVFLSLAEIYPVSNSSLPYLNRLSDLTYLLARYSNEKLQIKEQQPIFKYLEKDEPV